MGSFSYEIHHLLAKTQKSHEYSFLGLRSRCIRAENRIRDFSNSENKYTIVRHHLCRYHNLKFIVLNYVNSEIYFRTYSYNYLLSLHVRRAVFRCTRPCTHLQELRAKHILSFYRITQWEANSISFLSLLLYLYWTFPRCGFPVSLKTQHHYIVIVLFYPLWKYGTGLSLSQSDHLKQHIILIGWKYEYGSG